MSSPKIVQNFLDCTYNLAQKSYYVHVMIGHALLDCLNPGAVFHSVLMYFLVEKRQLFDLKKVSNKFLKIMLIECKKFCYKMGQTAK